MQLVWPAAEYLASYVQALRQGWSPNNVRPEAVPWKRQRGYATRALGLLLDDVRREQPGLTYVELTTEPDNVASVRVIEANGRQLVERFVKPAEYGGAPGLRYRIYLDA